MTFTPRRFLLVMKSQEMKWAGRLASWGVEEKYTGF